MPTTVSTTSTTTAPTTTIPPFIVEGAPSDLSELIEDFYLFAKGKADEAPPMPVEVAEGLPVAKINTPSVGVASVGVFKEQRLATVEMSGDVFLVVDDGSGWRIVGGNWPSLSVPAFYGNAPRFIALVGSDARPGESVTRTRADSIHIVALDGSGGGGVVGVPRDSWVPVPGTGTRKVNAALAIGGPDRLVETLRELSGLPIEGHAVTGFVGFQEMFGNVLGGINFLVPFRIVDSAAGANLEEGEQYLNGPDALAFARARKTLPGGDFTRSENQGLLLLGAAKRVRDEGYGAIPRLMEMSEPWLATDLSAEQLLTFSALAIGSDLEAVPNVVLPGRPGRAGGASVVFLDDSANEVWNDLSDGRLDG